MKNIILNIIGQRILTDILLEMKDITKMEVFYFENLDNCLKNMKGDGVNNIIIGDFNNLKTSEKLDFKIKIPIFYMTNKSHKTNVKMQFNNCIPIYYPFNFKNFVEKINLVYMKYQFADNSRVNLLNYSINLNTKEIFNNQKKLKLTEREKDFIIFLKNSNEPQTIKKILESVWGYSKGIETHTVETHVHRLRKKFLKHFNDTDFIKNNKKGYYI